MSSRWTIQVVDVKVNRELAGQLGVTTNQVARSLSEATYSSRFTTPNYWADPNTGIAYQLQVQYPQPRITSLQDVQNIPVMAGQFQHPLIGDLARVDDGTVMGEYDRRNGFRMLTLSANIAGQDLGAVSKSIDAAIRRAGHSAARHYRPGARPDCAHARHAHKPCHWAGACGTCHLSAARRQLRVFASCISWF